RWEKPSEGQQAVKRSHTKIRALVEQIVAAPKSWRLPRKLHCSPPPDHEHRPGRPLPSSGQLSLRMEKAQRPGGLFKSLSSWPGESSAWTVFIHSVHRFVWINEKYWTWQRPALFHL